MDPITLDKRFAVYVDSTDEPVPRAFYVGKGTQWRCNDRRSRNKVYRGIRERHGMVRSIAFQTDDEALAYAKEHELVLELKTHVSVGGANLDMGGLGGPAQPKSPEHRQKISDALKGYRKSDEHRAAISRAGKNKRLSDDHKRKIGASNSLAIQNDPALRAQRRKWAADGNAKRWAAYRKGQAALASGEPAACSGSEDACSITS